LGIVIGIATGRGKSVREQLKDELPKKYWRTTFVGYYNGAEIGTLAEDDRPDRSSETHGSLVPLAELMAGCSLVSDGAQITCRPHQVTIELEDPLGRKRLLQWLQTAVRTSCASGVQIVTSSHSLDIVAPGVSKNSLVSRIQRQLGLDTEGAVLCIGDRGQWPGNDYALLATPFSLSVDEVSADPKTCWNLAPPGLRGVQATVFYLNAIGQRPGGGFRVSLR